MPTGMLTAESGKRGASNSGVTATTILRVPPAVPAPIGKTSLGLRADPVRVRTVAVDLDSILGKVSRSRAVLPRSKAAVFAGTATIILPASAGVLELIGKTNPDPGAAQAQAR